MFQGHAIDHREHAKGMFDGLKTNTQSNEKLSRALPDPALDMQHDRGGREPGCTMG